MQETHDSAITSPTEDTTMIGPELDPIEPLDPGLPRLDRPVAPPLVPPPDRRLNVREVALILGVSERTVRRFASRKKNPLPGARLTARLWIFRLADVDAWWARYMPDGYHATTSEEPRS